MSLRTGVALPSKTGCEVFFVAAWQRGRGIGEKERSQEALRGTCSICCTRCATDLMGSGMKRNAHTSKNCQTLCRARNVSQLFVAPRPLQLRLLVADRHGAAQGPKKLSKTGGFELNPCVCQPLPPALQKRTLARLRLELPPLCRAFLRPRNQGQLRAAASTSLSLFVKFLHCSIWETGRHSGHPDYSSRVFQKAHIFLCKVYMKRNPTPVSLSFISRLNQAHAFVWGLRCSGEASPKPAKCWVTSNGLSLSGPSRHAIAKSIAGPICGP